MSMRFPISIPLVIRNVKIAGLKGLVALTLNESFKGKGLGEQYLLYMLANAATNPGHLKI
jgi:hypothetical protein